MRRGWTAAVLGLLLLWPAVVRSQDTDSGLRVGATLAPDVVGIDEVVQLDVRVDGGGFGRLRVEPDFALENLEIVAGPSRRESFSFTNGVTTRSESLIWHLRPLETGIARVHSIKVRVRDTDYDLGERVIRVQDEPPAERPRPQQRSRDPFEDLQDPFDSLWDRRERSDRMADPKVFLKADVDPPDPFVGQQTTYTLYLYTQADISAINPEELPDFRGFWVRDIPQPAQLTPEMVEIDGERYGRVILLRRALFPIRAGEQSVETSRAHIAMRVPEAGFFGSLLSRTRDVRRTSNDLKIQVRDLPAAPEDFKGAIGSMELTAELKPLQLEVGGAATLTLTLQGKGNLQGLTEPEISAPAGVRVFPPQQSSNETLSGTDVLGERSWSYVLVPDEVGQFEIPVVRVPYFDPGTGEFAVASTDMMSLQVTPAAEIIMSDVPVAATATSGDLNPIRGASNVVPVSATAQWRRVGTWLFAIPWGIVILLLVVRRHRSNGKSSRHARRRLEERLRLVKALERDRMIAVEIEDAWRQYLVETWDVLEDADSSRWGDLLVAKGVDSDIGSDMTQLTADIHYLRFAPQLSSTEALREELIKRSRSLLRSLR